MPDKKMIGPIAKLRVQETGLDFIARIDTGALISSIHAFDIYIEAYDAANMHNNKGKKIWFTTQNHTGECARLQCRIIDIPMIKSPLGTERRYIVELEIEHDLQESKVFATLRDRSHMDYKLLIGRNWLQGRFLVDVDLDEKE